MSKKERECLSNSIGKYVGNGDKTVAFRKDDIDDLRDKLQGLIYGSETVEKLKEAATDYILEKYNWDDVVSMTLEVYRR